MYHLNGRLLGFRRPIRLQRQMVVAVMGVSLFAMMSVTLKGAQMSVTITARLLAEM